jgi:AcrR family transcriptional regulator
MPTRKRVTKSAQPPKPTGRDAIRTAVLQSARGLFADKPYKDVTMRDIATGAAVNLGLLHRHFGTKEQILHDVIQSYAEYFRGVAMQGATPAEAMLAIFLESSQRPLLRTLANLVLADLPVNAFIAKDGALAVVLAGSAGTGQPAVPGKDADVLLAFALLMGWSLFDSFLVEASGNRVSREALRERTFALGRSLLATPEPATAPASAAGTRRRTKSA